jgi:hypothetical protein
MEFPAVTSAADATAAGRVVFTLGPSPRRPAGRSMARRIIGERVIAKADSIPWLAAPPYDRPSSVLPYQKDWRGNGLSNSEGRDLGRALSQYGISGGGDPSKTSERGRQQIRSLARRGRLPSQYRNFR